MVDILRPVASTAGPIVGVLGVLTDLRLRSCTMRTFGLRFPPVTRNIPCRRPRSSHTNLLPDSAACLTAIRFRCLRVAVRLRRLSSWIADSLLGLRGSLVRGLAVSPCPALYAVGIGCPCLPSAVTVPPCSCLRMYGSREPTTAACMGMDRSRVGVTRIDCSVHRFRVTKVRRISPCHSVLASHAASLRVFRVANGSASRLNSFRSRSSCLACRVSMVSMVVGWRGFGVGVKGNDFFGCYPSVTPFCYPCRPIIIIIISIV